MKTVALIMAGGLGARFWPRSSERHPKQFIHLLGEGTMIQNTVARLAPLFDFEDIYIVAPSSYAAMMRQQLPAIPTENFILEPFGRNTAPCLALSAITLNQQFAGDTIMTALPSDHIVHNVREFHQNIEISQQAAAELGGIVALGVKPTRPETGYGYVQSSDNSKKVGELFNQGVRKVYTFAEKPDAATANRFCDSGDFLWNTGIFSTTLDTFHTAFNTCLPDHAPLFDFIRQNLLKDNYIQILQDMYRQMRSVSVDYGIMEKSNNVYVVEGTFGWSDVGTWDELYRLSMKDAKNNVIEGDVIAINTTNCLVSTSEKFIGLVGVEDLIVIDSENAIVICKRGEAHNVKQLVDFMRRKQINRHL